MEKYQVSDPDLAVNIQSAGFPDYQTYQQAREAGASSYINFRGILDGGFPDYQIYRQAKKMGALSYAKYKKVVNGGFPDYRMYLRGKKSGFSDYQTYLQAKQIGATSYKEYQRLVKNGFPDYQTYLRVRKAGFNDYKTYLQAKRIGVSFYTEYRRVMKSGFPDYQAYQQARKAGFSDYQTYQRARQAGARTIEQWDFTRQDQAKNLNSAVNNSLLRIVDWLNSDLAIMSDEYSEEKLKSLDKGLLTRRKQLNDILALLKGESSIELREAVDHSLELLKTIKNRVIQVRERLDELTNEWLIINKEQIIYIFKTIRYYGRYIELGVLQEKLLRNSPNLMNLTDLCELLERVEDKTKIWIFDGKYVELTSVDLPEIISPKKNYQVCRVCKRVIIQEDELEQCSECLSSFHFFHLSEWIKIRGTCPVCRRYPRLK